MSEKEYFAQEAESLKDLTSESQGALESARSLYKAVLVEQRARSSNPPKRTSDPDVEPETATPDPPPSDPEPEEGKGV